MFGLAFRLSSSSKNTVYTFVAAYCSLKIFWKSRN